MRQALWIRSVARLALLPLAGAVAATVPAGPAAAGQGVQSSVEAAVHAKAGAGTNRSAVVTPMRATAEWLFGAVVLTAPIGSDREPDSWLFLAHAGRGRWTVGLERTDAFNVLAASAPAEVLHSEERDLLGSGARSFAAAGVDTGLQLPWAIDQYGKFVAGPHGWSGYDLPYSSLDLAGADGQVRAAGIGRAFSMCGPGGGYTKIYHDNGYITSYYHMYNAVRFSGQRVSTGERLGDIGQDLCAGGSTGSERHVHFSLLRDERYISVDDLSIGGWTFHQGSTAYAGWAEHSGIVRYPTDYLWNYGGVRRIGALTTDRHALVKEGGLSTFWTDEHDNVQQLALSGDRIGVLDTSGVLWVKEGGLSTFWTRERDGVRSFALSGDRIGTVDNDGTSWVKEGGLSAGWVIMHDNTMQIALSGNRVGVVLTDGSSWVKEGSLIAQWVIMYGNSRMIALSGGRVGVLDVFGRVLVKEGSLYAQWVDEWYPATHFDLSGDRIGVVDTNANSWAKEGGLSAGWVSMHDNTRQIDIAGDRIGVLDIFGRVWVKEGSLYAQWVDEWYAASRAALT
jgi:murein DD-endopeptidase MepM/ murein hydrolase activator NlpD